MRARWCAIALLFAAGAATSAELSRLFFTPAQRAALDSARRQSVRGEVVVIEKKQVAPTPQNVSVNGMVRRSDGKTTVWLNDRPITEQGAAGIDAAPGRSDDRVKLTVPGSERSVDLKVGQTVEILSGTIEEGYARRTVPPKPAAIPAQVEPRKSPDAEKAAQPPAPPPPSAAKPDPSSPLRAERARAREMRDEGAAERK